MIGNEILKQRLGKKLSVFELSKLTGVNSDVISRLETSERKFLSRENFDKLNTVLDLENYKEYIYSDTGKELGFLLKNARLQMGYTQIDVAIRAGYKGKSKISQLENGVFSKISEEVFLKLADALPLDRKVFEPFIQKNKDKKGRIIIENRVLIQKLVTEKRQNLSLSKLELSRQSGVVSNTITKIELYPEQKVNISKIFNVMHVLQFTKEEILSCFSNLEEEDLNIYLEEEKYVYSKKKSMK